MKEKLGLGDNGGSGSGSGNNTIATTEKYTEE